MGSASVARFFACGCLAGMVIAMTVDQVAAQLRDAQQKVPDFSFNQTAWVAFGEVTALPGSPPLLRQDPAHPFVPNNTGRQPTYRIADLTNPNLKPAAKARMKKDNDEVLAGKIAFTARSSCQPAGVPGFDSFGGAQPYFFVQTPKEVVIIFSGDEQVRHVYLDVPHSANLKPSWYGESIGHYEGDTLVVDTVGLNDRTVVDNYRTPHSEKLHVVERWRITNEGKTLEVAMRIEDPETYNESWSAVRRYRRVQATISEQVCAENNRNLFDYHIPVADTPDF
jgi:hypothetical protein